MIIVKIKGGVGNQLFQYAFGRTLETRGLDVRYDINEYDPRTRMDRFGVLFRLDHFNTRLKIADPDDISRLKREKPDPRLHRELMHRSGLFPKLYRKCHWVLDRMMYLHRSMIVERPYPIADHRIHGNRYIEGYFADYRYFKRLRSVLTEELTVRDEYQLPQYRAKAREIMGRKNPVSIHLRKWGGAKAKKANHDAVEMSLFGVLSRDYYLRAMTHVRERVEGAYYYIFSDDIPWAGENLQLTENHEFVHFGLDGDFLELDLMRLCRHHVLANSTFSLWAAYLDDKPGKIVVAPRKWYEDAELQRRYERGAFVPDEWIRT